MGEHSKPEAAPSFEERARGRPTTAAEEAFASYLELVDRGQPVDFEAFCRSRPELGGALEELHEHWLHVQSVVARLGAGRGAESGAEAPQAADEVSSREPAASELFHRLSRRERAQKSEPRYRLKGEISRGGMGAILRVWDEDLRRSLAMKIVLPRGVGHGSADKKAIGRFLEEAQITGQLDHPGIVPVHELGLDDQGRLFFTMRLVQGDHLGVIFQKSQAREQGWTRTRVLGILLRVCEAMAYAHEKGVVHRDLKPANIMVGRFGEAYVMDWGLARVLGSTDTKDVRLAGVPVPPGPPSSAVWTDRREERERTGSPLLTVDGDVIGTPSYMAPEQARGKLDELGPATDVYSVGAILYELLAGRAPYLPANGSSLAPHVVWHQVLAGPPLPLTQAAPDVSPELAAICERAMAREAAARYADMGAMAEDLRAFLENRVVRAYRTGALVELRKWIERNRGAAAALAALLVVALCAALAMAWVERRRTEGIRRYSDIAFAQELVQDFEERGPIDPEHVFQRESWLVRVAELAGRRAEHEAELSALRARALPVSSEEVERLRESHPDTARARTLEEILSQWSTGLEWTRTAMKDPAATLDRLERFQADIEAIELEQLDTRARVASLHEALALVRPWSFPSPEDRTLHTRLTRLEEILRRLLDEEGMRTTVERELQLAQSLADHTVADASRAWTEAIESIASSPRYGGLRIAPQVGLIPLRMDPESELWEFHHLLSGKTPRLGEDGRWRIGPETGIVLVLIPAGVYTIGAQSADPGGENFDPVAHPNEGPPVPVTLAPWFHGKYELTQGQWIRLRGANPSNFWAGDHYVDYGAITRSHPVESVTWDEARRIRLWGLVLPTEAQWEAAARAGTPTPFWFGERFEDGAFLINHGDFSAGAADRATPLVSMRGGVTDGFPFHAPVDRTQPNLFGLHATLGNVTEWCEGNYPETYARVEAWELDGRMVTAFVYLDKHAARGGSWTSTPTEISASRRLPAFAGTISESIGLRPSRPLDP